MSSWKIPWCFAKYILLIIWKNTMGLKIFLQNFGQYTLIKIEKEALWKSGGNSAITKIY